MKRLAILSAAIVAGGLPASALAWHNQGHMMTAAVAWTKMTDGARCRATMLLRSNAEYARGLKNPTGIDAGQALFVNAATWPDRIKATGSGFVGDGDDAAAVGAQASWNKGLTDHKMHKYWHFIDFPVPAGPGHQPPKVNAVERITLFSATIAKRKTPLALKAYDLAWLVHLVGDVHQPLHTTSQYGSVFSHGSDAGGNGIAINYPGYRELHGFWDGVPGDQKDNTRVLADSIAAAAALTDPSATDANISDPMAWAKESYALAIRYAFVAPVVMQSPGPFDLTATYASDAQRVTKAQIALGGARLANLLNRDLTWPVRGCS